MRSKEQKSGLIPVDSMSSIRFKKASDQLYQLGFITWSGAGQDWNPNPMDCSVFEILGNITIALVYKREKTI